MESNKNITTKSNIILISVSHLFIGIGIIALSTFIPAELKILGWNESIIAYIVGIATFFELSRMGVGYFGDSSRLKTNNFFSIGFFMAIFGLIIIANTLGKIFILIGMILFTVGSAIVSTLVDAYLIHQTISDSKINIAATTQFFRLSGFAVGGFLGGYLYENYGFVFVFYAITVIFFLGSLPALILLQKTVNEKKITVNNLKLSEKISKLIKTLSSKSVVPMSIFLILYPIGLFAQDAVLEPFAIEVLKFSRDGIGRMAGIWGTSTLIFIPLAIFIEKKIGRIITIFLGLLIASCSLLAIAYLGSLTNIATEELKVYQNSLFLILFIFGSGLGLMTTPSTAMMFDICAYNKGSTTTLIAFFGVLITLSRSFASFFSGVMLELTQTNFSILFFIEALILFSALFPLIYISRTSKSIISKTPSENTLMFDI